MEIPYIVTPRKDTGLFNSKIAIWLFLASEVMLFGGFFSAYVFLRVGADYPWPERTLPVLPGLINTFVLIGSSVTVVFAWAALKLRNWRQFQVYMWITIICAALFMVLKGIEYNVKFHHQAVRLNDYTVVEGHLGYEKDEHGVEVKNHNGNKIEENQIVIDTSKLTFSTVRFHKAWVVDILDQAEHHKAKITLAEDIKAIVKVGESEQVIAKAGEELSVKLLSRLQSIYLDARAHNGKLRTASRRRTLKSASSRRRSGPRFPRSAASNRIRQRSDAAGPMEPMSQPAENTGPTPRSTTQRAPAASAASSCVPSARTFPARKLFLGCARSITIVATASSSCSVMPAAAVPVSGGCSMPATLAADRAAGIVESDEFTPPPSPIPPAQQGYPRRPCPHVGQCGAGRCHAA